MLSKGMADAAIVLVVMTMTEKRPCDSERQTKESENFPKRPNLRTKMPESGKSILSPF